MTANYSMLHWTFKSQNLFFILVMAIKLLSSLKNAETHALTILMYTEIKHILISYNVRKQSMHANRTSQCAI